MNDNTDDTPRFDDPAREREWQAQENAMRHERLHLDPVGDDPRTLSYRLLTRALRVAPPGGLPKDFAQQVSVLASAPGRVRTSKATLETILVFTLAGVLMVSTVTAIIAYGATWWPAFEALVPAPSTAQWLMALVGCAGLSWLFGAWPRLVTNARHLR